MPRAEGGPAAARAILFYSATDDPAEWRALLAEALPGHAVRVWPDTGDPAAIGYALLWKAPPGLLKPFPNIRAVFALGAGVDPVLADPTIPPHLPVVRLVEPGLTSGMVEYVLLHCLYWHRNQHAYRRRQAERRWRQLPERLARERRIGILGLGVLGRAAAEALRGLGFSVGGWSRSARSIPGIACYSGPDGLDALLRQSEILVCLLPLTAATTGILGAELFRRLPAGAVVINAGRGGHLREDDLLAALDAGQLSGATLDVFAEEPLPETHPFWRHPQIVVTPHVASLTLARSTVQAVAANIRRFEAGEPLVGLVDRSRGY